MQIGEIYASGPDRLIGWKIVALDKFRGIDHAWCERMERDLIDKTKWYPLGFNYGWMPLYALTYDYTLIVP